MFDLTTEACLKQINNIYSVVILSAKRTVGLNRGEKSLLTEFKGEKPIMIAIEEIASGKITAEPLEKTNEPNRS